MKNKIIGAVLFFSIYFGATLLVSANDNIVVVNDLVIAQIDVDDNLRAFLNDVSPILYPQYDFAPDNRNVYWRKCYELLLFMAGIDSDCSFVCGVNSYSDLELCRECDGETAPPDIPPIEEFEIVWEKIRPDKFPYNLAQKFAEDINTFASGKKFKKIYSYVLYPRPDGFTEYVHYEGYLQNYALVAIDYNSNLYTTDFENALYRLFFDSQPTVGCINSYDVCKGLNGSFGDVEEVKNIVPYPWESLYITIASDGTTRQIYPVVPEYKQLFAYKTKTDSTETDTVTEYFTYMSSTTSLLSVTIGKIKNGIITEKIIPIGTNTSLKKYEAAGVPFINIKKDKVYIPVNIIEEQYTTWFGVKKVKSFTMYEFQVSTLFQ